MRDQFSFGGLGCELRIVKGGVWFRNAKRALGVGGSVRDVDGRIVNTEVAETNYACLGHWKWMRMTRNRKKTEIYQAWGSVEVKCSIVVIGKRNAPLAKVKVREVGPCPGGHVNQPARPTGTCS